MWDPQGSARHPYGHVRELKQPEFARSPHGLSTGCLRRAPYGRQNSYGPRTGPVSGRTIFVQNSPGTVRTGPGSMMWLGHYVCDWRKHIIAFITCATVETHCCFNYTCDRWKHTAALITCGTGEHTTALLTRATGENTRLLKIHMRPVKTRGCFNYVCGRWKHTVALITCAVVENTRLL